MLEGAPDAISASAYGLGSDRVRESPQAATCQRERGVRGSLIRLLARCEARAGLSG
jgi:hypothetical protein